MKFSKEKMMQRLERANMLHLVTEKEIAIMDNLDNQPVFNSWNRQVKGEAVYSCRGKDGIIYEVNENDCT